MAMQEAMYELRLRGAVSGRTLSVFEEMDMQTDTVLSGVIQDQAALHGIFDRIRDLGLEIVEVHQIGGQRTDVRSARSPTATAAGRSGEPHPR
ncbi:MAG: hypothetical protein ABW195_06900 [Ilumatobacteraceae bacterium]